MNKLEFKDANLKIETSEVRAIIKAISDHPSYLKSADVSELEFVVISTRPAIEAAALFILDCSSSLKSITGLREETIDSNWFSQSVQTTIDLLDSTYSYLTDDLESFFWLDTSAHSCVPETKTYSSNNFLIKSIKRLFSGSLKPKFDDQHNLSALSRTFDEPDRQAWDCFCIEVSQLCDDLREIGRERERLMSAIVSRHNDDSFQRQIYISDVFDKNFGDDGKPSPSLIVFFVIFYCGLSIPMEGVIQLQSWHSWLLLQKT